MRFRFLGLAAAMFLALASGKAAAQPITFQFSVGGTTVTSLAFSAIGQTQVVDVFMTQAAGGALSTQGLALAGVTVTTPGNIARGTATTASNPSLNIPLTSSATATQTDMQNGTFGAAATASGTPPRILIGSITFQAVANGSTTFVAQDLAASNSTVSGTGASLDSLIQATNLPVVVGAVPEPTSIALVGLVAAGGFIVRRRRSSATATAV